MSYKYFAFISYNSADIKWGKKLQRKLEHYRMPSTLCSEHKWTSKTPIRPVFFAPNDIQPGGLSDELKQRLESSRNLIVVCSPNSAKSVWVGKEIAYFHSLGRGRNIHFFIVAGKPHSGNPDTECFNPIVDELGIPEILGANIHEKIYRFPWLNKERAYVQLITKLLEVDFDTLWNRHKRLLVRQVTACVIAFAAVVSAVTGASLMSRPVDVEMRLNEVTPANSNLPPLSNAKVSLVLENEKKDTTFSSLDEMMVFTNVPAEMIGKEAKVIFSCSDYADMDTTLVLGKTVVLNISRDINAYGHVHFTLYDSHIKPLPGARISIGGIETVSDEKGKVDVIIPIPDQRTVYRISSDVLAFQDTLKDAKCGSYDAVMTE